jgi:hypothetical protein
VDLQTARRETAGDLEPQTASRSSDQRAAHIVSI